MTRSMTHPFTGFFLGLALLATPAAAGDGIEITGGVVDDGGRPLARAKVELERLPSFHDFGVRMLAGEDPAPVVASTRTGNDGGFRITAPEAGLWRVVVRHPRHLEMACALRPVLGPLTLPAVILPRRVEREARIVDEAGKPVPGARIVGHGWLRGTDYPPPFDWRPGFRYGTSADDGKVTLASAAGEALRLAALAGDRFGDQVVEPGAGDVTLRLYEMVDARVVDDGGRPLAGLVGLVHGPFPVGVTGKQGELRIPHLPGHKLTLLFVDAAGFVGGVSRDLTAEEVAEPPVMLRLPPTVEVDGRVVDAVRREPIADASVWTFDSFYRTDRHGGFRLRVPQDGAWEELWAAAEGYLVEASNPSPRKLPGGELVVALEPSLRLAGTVTDGDGTGITGAEIRAVPLAQRSAAGPGRLHLRDMHTVVVARSGADGRFSLDGLRPALGYELRVGHRGYAPRRTQVPGLDPTAVPEALEIILTPGIEAAGVVLDADQQPVPGARVALEEARMTAAAVIRASGKKPRYEVVASADGRFSFSDLPPGTFVLDARAPGFAPRTVPGIEITADSADLGTVSLQRAPAVHGRVIDGDGDGIADATVSVSASQPSVHVSAVTVADGAFTLEDLPPATSFSVTVWSPGYVTENHQQITFEPERPLEIVLEKSRTVSGQVVDAEGDGVAGARVQLDTLRSGRASSGTSRGTDGSFRVAGLAAGEWTIAARLANDGRSVSRQVTLAGSGDEVEIELRFELGYRLVGHVLRDGARLGDSELEIRCPQSSLNVWVAIHGGRFVHDGVPAGSCALSVRDRQLGVRTVARQIEVDGDTDVTLEFTTAVLTGRVATRGGREPVAGAVVELREIDSGRLYVYVETGSDGRFEKVVESGRSWNLHVSAAGFVGFQSSVAVEQPGRDIEILIEAALEAPPHTRDRPW